MAVFLLVPLLLCVSVLHPAGSLTITDVTHSTMRLMWDAAPPPVLKYTIVYKSEDGDLKKLEVDGAVTTAFLRHLISQTEYEVSVTPVYAQGPAAPALSSATTGVVPAPKDLHFSQFTNSSFRVTWERPAPDVALYRLSWTKSTERHFRYLILSDDETFAVLNDLEPNTEYSVSVTAIYPDESESEDLIRNETTRDDKCKTTAKADIVLLVDGSWSIGRINFKTVRYFIVLMASAFNIGPERVQIGLAQYSKNSKTEWHLNSHPTESSLLPAIYNIGYMGGNTMTGSALNHTFHHNFCPNEGLRDDAQQILVLITDGRSQDNVAVVSRKLRDSGVELYAIDLVPPLPSVSSRLVFQQSPWGGLLSAGAELQGAGVELQSGGSVLVRRGLDIIVSCFVQSHSLDGHFLLQTPSGNHTLPADNHRAHFPISAFGSTHSGPYTCVYLPQVPCRNLTFRGPFLRLKVGDLNRDLLIRAVVVLPFLLSFTLLQFYYYFYCYKPPGPGPGPGPD